MVKKYVTFLLHKSTPFTESKVDSFKFQSQRTSVPKNQDCSVSDGDVIEKTSWTAILEFLVQYLRIQYDIFLDEHRISILIPSLSSRECEKLINWHQAFTMETILKSICSLNSLPTEEVNVSPCASYGISLFLDVIVKEIFDVVLEISKNVCEVIVLIFTPLLNDGNVVEISSLLDKSIKKKISKLPAESFSLVKVFVEFLIPPLSKAEKVEKSKGVNLMEKVDITRQICARFYHCCNDMQTCAISVVKRHFNLISAIISGIPMKEESGNNASFNYDVEILLPSFSSNPESKDLEDSSLLYLHWSTPKGSLVNKAMNLGKTCYPVTPVNLNARPTSCLANFILGGRTVMLDSVEKQHPLHGGSKKTTTHMLSDFSTGRIFMFRLTNLSTPDFFEDAPSISEGAGGKVTDYRINDMAALVKRNTLRSTLRTCDVCGIPNLSDARKYSQISIERQTRVWPLNMSDAQIFNMDLFSRLTSSLNKRVLNSADAASCFQELDSFIAMHVGNKPLTPYLLAPSFASPSLSSKYGRFVKKEADLYKVVWHKLLEFCKAHSTTSLAHKSVLEHFLAASKRRFRLSEDDADDDHDAANLLPEDDECKGNSYSTSDTEELKASQREDENSGGDVAMLIPDNGVKCSSVDNTREVKKIEVESSSDVVDANETEKVGDVSYRRADAKSPSNDDGAKAVIKVVKMEIDDVNANKKTSLLSLWNELPANRSQERERRIFRGREVSNGKFELYEKLLKEFKEVKESEA